MEHGSSTIAFCGAAIEVNSSSHLDCDGLTKNKKRRRMPLIRLALYILNMHKSRKSKCVPDTDTTAWKKFVASVRPLHLQSHQSPPRVMEAQPVPSPVISFAEHVEIDKQLLSPAYASAGSSPCVMSEYASATNLYELDELGGNEENDENNGFYDIIGDGMIDIKAEEFIAQFYQQIRLQHEAYRNNGT